MPGIGIVTCQILELEFAYLLSRDRDVKEIWVIENSYSQVLTASLEKNREKSIHMIRHPREFKALANRKTAVLIHVKEVGLHSHIPTLQKEVGRSVGEMAPFVGAVFLGYGLCGNAFRDMEGMFGHMPVPVAISMDREGPVDDCVGLIIGGRDAYYAEQCKCAGTMFINAGFSKYCEAILSSDIPERLKDKEEEIMQMLMAAYKRCLLLPTPVMDEKRLLENTREFNKKYRLKVESRPGTLALLQKGWENIKRDIFSPVRA